MNTKKDQKLILYLRRYEMPIIIILAVLTISLLIIKKLTSDSPENMLIAGTLLFPILFLSLSAIIVIRILGISHILTFLKKHKKTKN